MSFLKRASKEEEVDMSAANEEMYERLFPKIGRDFVYKEDLKRILREMMLVSDPAGENPVDYDSDTEARKRAYEYKQILDSGVDGSTRFVDLIELDDEEDKPKKKSKDRIRLPEEF
jgi:hypothetical protein